MDRWASRQLRALPAISKKPGGIYENDKPRENLHRCRPALHAAYGVKRSGANEPAHFNQHQRDPLHARTCLPV